jgi:hypothetical protein
MRLLILLKKLKKMVKIKNRISYKDMLHCKTLSEFSFKEDEDAIFNKE